MATADKLEWPQGTPLFELAFRALSEGMNGVGVLAGGDMEVTSTATANEISVSTGDLWVPNSTYTIGTAETHVLSDNTSGSDRWDTVVFDTSLATPASAVVEGTAGADPEPPDLSAGQILLAYIYVPDGATDTPDSRIYNWRAFSTDAADVRLDDSAGDYSSSNVENALTEVIREAGDPLNGPLDLSSFSGSAPFDLGTNPTAFGPIVDATVDSNSAAGTSHSYTFALDGTNVLQVYAESDGAGGLQNVRVDLLQTVRIGGDLKTTGGTTIFDSANGHVRKEVVETLRLNEDTDGDLNGSNLTDSAGPGTLYDATAGEFPRGVLDDEKTTTTVTTATYTSSDEELILVDTATIAADSTITLASADAESGATVVVADLSGAASSNVITVDTEGTETINGASSFSISTDYVGATFSSDGSNWVTTGTAPLDPNVQVEGTETGAVASGDHGTLIIDSLADGETLEIYKAIFSLSDGQPAPSSLNLVIATLDNSGGFTERATIYSGDGATVWDGDPSNSIGDPLASWTNATGARETVAVLADNSTASSQDLMAKVTGERVP